jgi:hypothetical protein
VIRWPFGKKPPQAPSGEDLALRLLQGEWQCASCNEWHNGLMDLGATAPDPWPHALEPEPNSALRLDGDFLSEDFCVIRGTNFLVRCVMEFPVHGLEQPWGFGCWSTLSRENFDKYIDGFDDGIYADDGPWFGWLCNQLKPIFVEPDPIGLAVCPRPNRQRPALLVRDEGHPLAIAQNEGLAPGDLIEIFRAYGHGPTLQ